MDIDLAHKAVSAALKGNWQEAVTLNKQILKSTPNDIDALNRLGRAYAEIGDFKKAKAVAQKVLKLDPFNTIATKAIKKWQNLKGSALPSLVPSRAEDFLEEPGKTKVISLLHLGDPVTIAKLDSGDEVKIVLRGHRVCIVTIDNHYIGRLTDDLTARLRNLIKMGNVYQVLVKSNKPGEVRVFIREIAKGPKAVNILSFPAEKIDYVSFTPPELVRKKEPLAETGELEEEPEI